MTKKRRIVCAFGTRPEAIKMAPVYQSLAAHAQLEPSILVTGQHREQLQQALSLFNLPITANLDVMSDRQTLPELAARIIPQAAAWLRHHRADYVLVHGDTMSTFALAWAAFLERIPVGHVEAGLRTFDLAEPFPEEANRRLTDSISDLCLAPTRLSRENLLLENIGKTRIVVTGQTGIDAIRYAAKIQRTIPGLGSGPFITITLHRRENLPELAGIARALRLIARRFPARRFVYPVHLNPAVREAVCPLLSDEPNLKLLEPLEYGPMASLLAQSELLITDSGGLQEEGAALGVPVVVLRNVTERPEGVETGILRLAGTNPDRIQDVVSELLSNDEARMNMSRAKNPYGDGAASARVTAAVAWRLERGSRPTDWG